MPVIIEPHVMFSDMVFIVNETPIDNDKLEKECYYISSNLSSKEMSNVGGYQSPPISYKLCEEHELTEFIKLVNTIENTGNQIAKENNAKQLNIENIWININKKYDYNATHTHPGSILSGAYYVKVPDTDDKKASGVIQFLRDRSVTDYDYMSWAESPRENSNHPMHPWHPLSTTFSLKPKNGNMYLFYSHIQHQVLPSFSDEDRISIAFNMGVVEKD